MKASACLYPAQEPTFSPTITWPFGTPEQWPNGSRANNVPRASIVNCCVDWHGAFYTVNNEEPAVAGSSAHDPHISLVIDFEMCFFLFLYN